MEAYKNTKLSGDTHKTPVRNTYWVVVSDVFYFHPYFGEMIQFGEYGIHGAIHGGFPASHGVVYQRGGSPRQVAVY